MQEKLARLHFSLDSHVEELSEDQRKCASDHNLEHLLSNVSTNHSSRGSSFVRHNVSFHQVISISESLNINFCIVSVKTMKYHRVTLNVSTEKAYFSLLMFMGSSVFKKFVKNNIDSGLSRIGYTTLIF